MSLKLSVNKFEWIEDTSQFNKYFTKNYNEESDDGYFFEVDVQYPQKLHGLHNDLPFLPERMKIEKVEKFITNVNDKTEYVIHIRNLKQLLNHGLILEKAHRVIKSNKLVTVQRRRNYLVSEPNFNTTKLFTENFLTKKKPRKTQILMNKPVY